MYHTTNFHPFAPLTFPLPHNLGQLLPLAYLACETQTSGSREVLWLSGQSLRKVTEKVSAEWGGLLPKSQLQGSRVSVPTLCW